MVSGAAKEMERTECDGMVVTRPSLQYNRTHPVVCALFISDWANHFTALSTSDLSPSYYLVILIFSVKHIFAQDRNCLTVIASNSTKTLLHKISRLLAIAPFDAVTSCRSNTVAGRHFYSWGRQRGFSRRTDTLPPIMIVAFVVLITNHRSGNPGEKKSLNSRSSAYTDSIGIKSAIDASIRTASFRAKATKVHFIRFL